METVIIMMFTICFFFFSHFMMKSLKKMKAYIKLIEIESAQNSYLNTILWGALAFVCLFSIIAFLTKY